MPSVASPRIWLLPLVCFLCSPCGCGAQAASPFPLPEALYTFRLLQTAVFPNNKSADIQGLAMLGDVETHSLDSHTGKIKFLQPWSQSVFPAFFWAIMESVFRTYFAGFQQTVINITHTLNGSYPIVVQSLLFCETDSIGLTRAFYDAALNGEAVVTYQADKSMWFALKKDKTGLYIQDFLNQDNGTTTTLHNLLTTKCIEALHNFLQAGKATVDRQVPPDGMVFTEKSSVPDSQLLVCRVTGFHPRQINVSWLQDGTEVSAESTGILPNHDVTYQIRRSLIIKSRDTHNYACKIQHSALGKSAIIIPWGEKSSNKAVPAVIGILVCVALIIMVVLIFRWKKRREYQGIAERDPPY
ncbi:antigen-presenting glycoprotein CD1d-like [Python bivittatus]|uniref:Antigen-presenting glycoprotein CD1d-like n=1 Tax=Python bivittatus TaxID=176946 RepID=A0A9F2WHQ0_PYTBI|nr:antigen-presenting glycoprotein CD1d-like [Python bivittatus]